MSLQTKVGIREFSRGVGISDTMIIRHRKAGTFAGAEAVNENNGRPMLIMPLALKLWAESGGEIKGEYTDGRWGDFESVKIDPPATSVDNNSYKNPEKKTKPEKKKDTGMLKNAVADPKKNTERAKNDTKFTPPADQSAPNKHIAPPQTFTVPQATDGGIEIPTKAKSEQVRAFWSAESERIKVEEKLKTLVPRHKVERQLFQAGQSLRQELESMPRRIAAFMTGNKKIDEHRMRIEIEKILTRFVENQRRVLDEEVDENE